MLPIARLCAVVFFCSINSLCAQENLQEDNCSSEALTLNTNTNLQKAFDQVCEFIGFKEQDQVKEVQKKGTPTQQHAFESCLKDSLQTKQSLDFCLKALLVSSIFLTAASSIFFVREAKTRCYD